MSLRSPFLIPLFLLGRHVLSSFQVQHFCMWFCAELQKASTCVSSLSSLDPGGEMHVLACSLQDCAGDILSDISS